MSVSAVPSTAIKLSNAVSLPPLINASASERVKTGTVPPETTALAFVIAVFKLSTSIVSSLIVKDSKSSNDPVVNSLGVSATALVSNVPIAEIVEEDIVVTSEAFTCSVVASLIVFRSAALLVESSASIVIVQAFVSSFSSSGVRNSVKEATLVPLAIVAVTVPLVSAAIVFAFATLTPTVLSTVTA